MSDRTQESGGTRLLNQWARCRRLPMGAWLFGRLIGLTVPYSGTIGAEVRELSPGLARIAMRDRRGLRNHLGSLHAVALTNLGELTSGLAMTTALPGGVKSIVTGLETRFTKKARGVITAESRVTLPAIHGDTEHRVEAELRDAAGDVVARVTVTWRLRPA